MCEDGEKRKCGLKKIYFSQSIMGKNGLETQIVVSQFITSEKHMYQNHIDQCPIL